ncbi:diguanylate cyclase (GGDEF)-like protein/PAS domain S-box-containing protein [Natronospira proteinivora]|uniref:Diguanylate cyclase (GGDEF)-like protein/PAS domain S-box-containing protein n=1 Tax=Natronospira proteinivora TaxID=1807133 RepID=A0ABT1G9T0_9GAMM|nr:EAL domain-containing protein [Natronospira proteinivora]MCP1727660.1 diguanylate cyclase (GGDEF)-like protein/PAS domain S-box-containing protein [Natronospira proteinivora]
MPMIEMVNAEITGVLGYEGSYSGPLVMLSLIIAIMAAFASISHVDLMRSTPSRAIRFGWHLNGAVCLGIGVWTMHFTGMVAFQLPLPVQYHMTTTLASVLPAILAAYIALTVLQRTAPSARAILLGGTFMGLGIGAMHYLGMTGMVLDAEMTYQRSLVLLSVIVAVVMSNLALATPRLLGAFMVQRGLYQPLLFKLSSAVFMGLAISSLHYVAMAATRFLPGEAHSIALPGPNIDPNLIAGLAVGASLFILVTSTITVTLRHRIEAARLEAEISRGKALEIDNRFKKIVSRLPGVVYQFRMDADGTLSFPYASEAIRDIYGMTPEAVQHDANILTDIIHPDDLDGVFTAIQESAESMTVWRHEYRVNHPELGLRWLQGNAMPELTHDGAILWSGFITDITNKKQSEERIHQLAFYDELTGLPNRRLLEERMGSAQSISNRHACYGAMLFLDLDAFKRLNDTLGHSVGDELLKTLAYKLNDRLRDSDTVARIGGDEFVIILNEVGQEENDAAQRAGLFAEDIQSVITEPLHLSGHDYRCSASIGITLFRGDQDSREELLRRADTAMYQAKATGRNSIRFYNPALQATMEKRFRMESDLRNAIGGNGFFLVYQNQVDAKGITVGSEALLRWRHPEKGIISPIEFIPVAEDTGLILPLGHWVLKEACLQLRQWQRHEAFREHVISINVSAKQFHQKDFVDQVQKAVDGHEISPDLLKLELTESLVLEDIEDSTCKMQQLRALGIQLSMDDFGTGYSSMAYLSRLPFDEVKIDKSFVQSAGHHHAQRDWIIIEGIIGLAKNLRIRVIAEGVESEAQHAFLVQLGCQYFQGYYFGRPKDAETFAHAS